ncbi:hypothetical protein [Methylorubrum podarium]|uniref:hypothetical protein n=1 Tax=Methylorubrum podarium TaxID=200476 RepID=UPI001EE23790|nr:hypothetical protein [Methylorubrum podarium]GJE73116.1 hypothetical protein CHKEEEPN_4679 [Methylorubrum podarium]
MIDVDVLVETVDGDQVRLSNSYKRLIELWRKLGVLVVPEQSVTESSIANRISSLPLRHRKLWQVALKDQRKKLFPTPKLSEEVFSAYDKLVTCSPHVEVAFVEDVKALVFGIPSEFPCGYVDEGDIEICRYDCCEDSALIKKADALASSIIPSGSSIDELWSCRFHKISQYSRHIAVVDRYCVETMQNRRDGKSGLKTFLSKVASTGNRNSVHIYTGHTTGDRDALAQEVFDCLDDSGLFRSLYLHVLADQDFGAISHGRYVRFDDIVISVDTGLEIFQGDTVFRNSEFSLKYDAPERKAIEQSLRQAGKTYQVI